MELIDIDTISSLQIHLSSLTGLYLSLYGEKGNVILPPVKESKLSAAVRASPKGREEYNDFVKRNIEIAIHRSDVSLFEGPTGISHFFAPVRVDNTIFVVVGGGVFLSKEDFEDFCRKDFQTYGIYPQIIQAAGKENIIRNHEEVRDQARYIRSIFSLVLRGNFRGNLNEKRFRLMKTILSLISAVRLEKQAEEVYDILADTMLFLFNADSIAVMARDNGIFRAKKTAGRLREHLSDVSLTETGIISEAVQKQKPVHSDSVLDILRSGFTEDVLSFHLFPIVSADRVAGFLGIFNTEIPHEDALIINEICKITGFILRLIELQYFYTRCISEIDSLNSAAERLTLIREPEVLYETILETSVHLTSAEKASLMIAEDDTSHLIIKAAKGINKRLLSEIKIKAGEGIAGWVFREGIPLRVDDIEKNERVLAKKRPKYRTGSFISIPLRSADKTIGVLNISDKLTGGVFSEEDMLLLRSFASYASIALDRANYYSLVGYLRELSITDSLTGLFNRRYFEERFFEEINRSDRHNLTFSLIMMDIDDFKVFNDTEGHLAGDEILKSIASIAKDCLRISDVISRFGGEEFAVIMPQTDKDEAYLVAERIRKSVKEQIPQFWSQFPKNYITLTMGVVTYPPDGKDRKELIRNADRALYRGKMEGKDRTVLWGV
ncbi:MAG: diguanylate cyclase [Nitrospirota bacterium]